MIKKIDSGDICFVVLNMITAIANTNKPVHLQKHQYYVTNHKFHRDFGLQIPG